MSSPWIVLLFLFNWAHPCVTQTINDTDVLMTSLLSKYNKLVRPSEDQSKPVYMNVSFDLVSIQKFDELTETLTLVGMYYFIWQDPRMAWDPAAYGNINSVIFPEEYIWKPYLIHGNPGKSITPMGHEVDPVRFSASGYALWMPGDQFELSCMVDLTYFPFDTQTCEILLIPWGISVNEVLFIASSNVIQKTFLQENGEWQLGETRTYSEVIGEQTFFKTRLQLERRPLYFLLNIILPILFMGCLNILVFILPAESGERTSFSITVLLAIAVFLTLVGDNMPKSSLPMPLICYFLVSQLSLSVFICVTSILNLKIFFKGDSESVPPWLVKIVNRLAWMLSRQGVDMSPQLVETSGAPPVVMDMIYISKDEPKQAWSEECITEPGNKEDNPDVTWSDVSHVVDMLLCIGSTVWLVVSVVAFMSMVSNQTAKE